jgi:ribosomal protein S18 acetylase RimI-like enzyme
LRSAAQIQHIAYREPGDVADADLARLQATVDNGGVVILALCGGAPAGGGLATPPRDGLAELAGVGVIPGYQGRGIASALVAALTRSVFAVGTTPYLQTETTNEQRLYGRLGYRTIGELTATSLSPPAPPPEHKPPSHSTGSDRR